MTFKKHYQHNNTAMNEWFVFVTTAAYVYCCCYYMVLLCWLRKKNKKSHCIVDYVGNVMAKKQIKQTKSTHRRAEPGSQAEGLSQPKNNKTNHMDTTTDGHIYSTRIPHSYCAHLLTHSLACIHWSERILFEWFSVFIKELLLVGNSLVIVIALNKNPVSFFFCCYCCCCFCLLL